VSFKALDDVVDALGRYLRAAPQDFVEAVAPADSPSLLRVFPVLGAVPGLIRDTRTETHDQSTPEIRDRAFGALIELWSRMAQRERLVLVIEDVHWGDIDSLGLLSRLFTSPVPPPMLLVASHRDEDSDANEFLEEWRLLRKNASAFRVVDLEVAPLPHADALALTRALAARHVSFPATLIDEIAGASRGSPFLIEQLVTDAAVPDAADDSRIGDRFASAGFRRLTNLSAAQQQLLETVALARAPIAASHALAAAGVEQGRSAAVRELAVQRLIRVRLRDSDEHLELYHDALRPEICDRIPAEAQRERHLALARCYMFEDGADAARAGWHLAQAGETLAAARYLLRAADSAEQALAFDRAAQLYAEALTHLPDRGEDDGIRLRLARAYAYAGRGPEAADAYLTSAASAPVEQRPHLRLRAAEQLLRSGHTDRGLTLLEDLARSLGAEVAHRPWRAIASLLFSGGRIAMAGLRPRARARPPSARDVLVLDVLWSLAAVLAMTDVVRGCAMQARHLQLALRYGDGERAAMSMAANAASITTVLGRESIVTRALQRRAHALASALPDETLHAVIACMDTVAAVTRGEWALASELGAIAERLLRNTRREMAWERALNDSMLVTAALFRGDWERLVSQAVQLPRLVDEARRRGDVHTLQLHLNGVHLGHFVRDRPDACDELYGEVFSYLPAGYYLPHFLYLLARADTALYRGDSAAARSSIEGDWPALSRSFMLRVPHLAVLAFHLRGRVAVAAASHEPAASQQLCLEALAAARHLDRTHVSWAPGLAAATRAGAETLAGRRDGALDQLAAATRILERHGMAHLVAACRYRRSQLMTGAESHALRGMADAWARRVGIVNMARVCAVLVPGNWGASPDGPEPGDMR
jgi:hypothetical protein